MKIKKILTTIFTISFITLFLRSSVCSALDMEHDETEEIYLQDNALLYAPCFGHKNDECEKYLVRYDAVEPIIEHFKKLIGENTNHVKAKNRLATIGIGTLGLIGTGAGFYYKPLVTFAVDVGSLIALPTVCTVHNELIEPVGETVSMVTKIFIKLRNWLSGNKPITNADKGMVGNALDVLCGDKTKENHNYGLLEGFRKLIFGETSKEVLKQNKKKEVYSKVLDDLYEKIDNKEFENIVNTVEKR